MDDLKFKIEIDGIFKEAEIVFSYYDEDDDRYYIVFEIEDQEELEAAILVSKSNDEVILEDIESDEKWEKLLSEYDLFLMGAEALKNEED